MARKDGSDSTKVGPESQERRHRIEFLGKKKCSNDPSGFAPLPLPPVDGPFAAGYGLHAEYPYPSSVTGRTNPPVLQRARISH